MNIKQSISSFTSGPDIRPGIINRRSLKILDLGPGFWNWFGELGLGLDNSTKVY